MIGKATNQVHPKLRIRTTFLTESSYFQEVRQEMAEVNLDEFWS